MDIYYKYKVCEYTLKSRQKFQGQISLFCNFLILKSGYYKLDSNINNKSDNSLLGSAIAFAIGIHLRLENQAL